MAPGGIALATDFAIVIVTATILSHIARQTGQPTLIAYILTGIVLGPVLLGVVTEDELIEVMAELGLGFLLFLLGIEMRFDRIRDVLRPIVTMLGSTLTQQYADVGVRYLVDTGLLESDIDRVRRRSHVTDDLTDHVIVTGYDREGQQVVEACEAADHPYVVIESDPRREEHVREHCENYVFGDVMTSSTWTVANAEEATLIVATVAREKWAEQILSFEVDADGMVRAIDVETGAALLDRGAMFVAVPDVLAAEQLQEHVEDVLTGETTAEELRELGEDRLERGVEYGPSDVQRIR